MLQTTFLGTKENNFKCFHNAIRTGQPYSYVHDNYHLTLFPRAQVQENGLLVTTTSMYKYKYVFVLVEQGQRFNRKLFCKNTIRGKFE